MKYFTWFYVEEYTFMPLCIDKSTTEMADPWIKCVLTYRSYNGNPRIDSLRQSSMEKGKPVLDRDVPSDHDTIIVILNEFENK